MNKYRSLKGMVVFTFIMLISVGASTAIKLFQRWVADSERIYDLERATMTAELEQLKNQINPHFLFNMLNNANVLTQQDPEKASQLLMKLSDLLRYQLYDSSRSAVLLTSDINFLTDFLNLEKTRRDNFEYSITTTGDLKGVQIPPLLFITFVENAVKHNVDGAHNSYVHLYFDVQNTALHFKCINSKPDTTVLKNGFGGLGLANIKRRLQLLYDQKYTLDISEEKSLFTVTLTIQL